MRGTIELDLLDAIGEAIQDQLATENRYTPENMPAAIRQIHGPVKLQSKVATQNGIITADAGYDGLHSVTVNVSGGGTAVVQPLTVNANGTYTPPSGVDGFAPVTVNVSGGVSLDNDILFHFDSDFKNSGKRQCVFSNVTGLSVSDEQSKFGSKSLKTTTTQTRYNVQLGVEFALGTDDFTLDFWCYPLNLPSDSSFVVPISFDYRSIAIYMRQTGMQFGIANSDGDSWLDIGTIDTQISNNAWHHVAIVRDGTQIFGYLNGVKLKTIQIGSSALAPMSTLTLGSNTYSSGDRRFRGYIDEVRLRIGEAVWTDNFTPPTQPYS